MDGLNTETIERQLLLAMRSSVTGYATYLKRLAEDKVKESWKEKNITEEQVGAIIAEVLVDRLSLIVTSFAATVVHEVYAFRGEYPKLEERKEVALNIAFAAFKKALGSKDINLYTVHKRRELTDGE
jgi:hypothetical protein